MSPDTAAGLVLAVAGAGCGVGTLLAMRRFSDQRAIRTAKSRIRAHLYELRLFGDDPVLALRAQGKLLRWNLRYLRLSLAPALVVMVPALLVGMGLESLFGSRPLTEGEAVLVTARLRGAEAMAGTPSLEASAEFRVESPAVVIPELREICWRVRALRASDGLLRVRVGDRAIERVIQAGPGLRAVTATDDASNDLIKSTTVDYQDRKIELFGVSGAWWIWFALSWLAAMVLLRRRARVTF